MRFLLLFFLSFQVLAQDIPQTLIDQLGNEDFDLRESATEALCRFPDSEANHFYILYQTYKTIDPEISERLLSICANLIFQRSYKENSNIKGLLGTIGVGYQKVYIGNRGEDYLKKATEALDGQPLWVAMITQIDLWGPSNEKLKDRDCILRVGDNTDRDLLPQFQPDKEYTFLVLRFKDSDAVVKNNCITDADAYDIVTVTVKAIKKDLLTPEEENQIAFLLRLDWRYYLEDKADK